MSYIGATPTSTAFLTDSFSGDGSTTSFTLTAAPASSSSILVAVSGVLQDPATYAVVGTALNFTGAPPSGTANISVRYLGIPASNISTAAYRTVTEFTATAGQTSFSTPSYTVGFINVYRNGVLLGSADYTATTGTTVVLASGATAGDLITTESFYVSSIYNAISNTAGSVNSNNIADGAVGTAEIADGAVTTAKLAIYEASALVVAGGGGGGGGGAGGGGGGGGGGFVETKISLSVGTTYTATIGPGGSGGNSSFGTNGTNSTLSGSDIMTITALGGGGGAWLNTTGTTAQGNSGGSGGGSSCWDYTGFKAGGIGAGNQGHDGGSVYGTTGGNRTGSGGGGAGNPGGNSQISSSTALSFIGAGGSGAISYITGSAVYYAGGGGGSSDNPNPPGGGTGGNGGGGAGSYGSAGTAGTANTGGGGGGSISSTGGAGGSGVIILSVPTVNYTGTTTGSPTVTTSGAFTVIKFTSSGTYTA